MFTIDLSSKRAKLALRFFTYGVMTVSTIVLSTILVFFALGYRLDRNFNFTQGGLVQFRSFPDNTEVVVDGKKQDFKTPNKLNVAAGQHTATYNLQGYRPWTKTFALEPGQLVWLNYARLFPESITTTGIREFDSLAQLSASPDRHWLLLQQKTDSSDFVLADISNEKEPKYTSFQLPESLLTKQDGALGNFEIIEWDLSSRYALIKHQVGSVREYLRVDRTKLQEPININKVFGLATQEAHFSGNNPNIVFANTEGVLRRLDIGNSSASGALVNGLKQFVVYGSNAIAFSSEQERTVGDASSKQQLIGVLRDDKATIVRTVPVEQQSIFAYSEYDNHDYLALASADSSKVDVIRDPSDAGSKDSNTIFAQFDLGISARWISFSNNGRMIVVQNGNTFATYDLEEAKSYQTNLNFGVNIDTPLRWLDDFYLWTDAGGSLRVFEFDGKNERQITNLVPSYGVVLSSNGKRLFSASQAPAGKFTLQTSKLTTEQ